MKQDFLCFESDCECNTRRLWVTSGTKDQVPDHIKNLVLPSVEKREPQELEKRSVLTLEPTSRTSSHPLLTEVFLIFWLRCSGPSAVGASFDPVSLDVSSGNSSRSRVSDHPWPETPCCSDFLDVLIWTILQQVTWQEEQVSRVHVNAAQVCHHLVWQETLPPSPGAGQTGPSRIPPGSGIKCGGWDQSEDSARRTRPLWSSGSDQFYRSEDTFVKCLGPLAPSEEHHQRNVCLRTTSLWCWGLVLLIFINNMTSSSLNPQM